MIEHGMRVGSSRWFVLFASFLIMCASGATYIFGLYSEAIKVSLGYDQETLTTLGFFKDLGANVGIVSGLINEITPPWVVLAVGAVMNLSGYMMMWLAVTGRIEKPKVWQMYLYMFMGANSQTFANTGALVTCVNNFPQSRGVVIGLLKGFVGLSGAMFTQIYHALYGHDSRSLILLIGWLPSIISLLFMFAIRYVIATSMEREEELKRFYTFLYIALALAGFLMVFIVIQNTVRFSVIGYRAMVGVIVVFLLLPLVVVVKAELKHNGSQRLEIAHQNSPMVSISNHEASPSNKNEDSASNKNEDSASGGNPRGLRKSVELTKIMKKVFKGPKRGDDFTIPQALVSVDMLILFIATTCGVGATLTAIDNMGQIGKALGFNQVEISTLVSLISIWNFLGRVASGFSSEIILHKYNLPRPIILSFVLALACIGHLFIAFALPGSLYVASIILGLCFGAQWPVVFAVISELFGLRYYSTLYNFGAAASPLGSYLLSVKVAGFLYDREAAKQHKSSMTASMPQKQLNCIGVKCFQLTFIIMTVVTMVGSLISGILVLRTRDFYRGDIYARFQQVQMTHHQKDSVEPAPKSVDKEREH